LSNNSPVQNGLKQGDALSPLLLTLLKNTIKKVQENNVRLKLNGTHQLFVHADDVNLLGDNINTIKKNIETLIDASKDVGLEINAGKLRICCCLFTKMEDNIIYIKIAKRYFENVEQFRDLGTTVTNRNLIQEKIKRGSNSGNTCYNSVQNLLSSRLLSKEIEIKTNKIYNFARGSV
jgi:hypothetical protein